MKSTKFRYILSILLALLIGYTVGVNKVSLDWHNFQPDIQVTSKEPPASVMPLDFTLFWTVMQKIETNYYDKTLIDPQKMLNGAITGMVNSLNDPYTLYLPPQQNNNFKQTMAGQFQGIGAELGVKNKLIIVVAPLDGSPAEKAGLKTGDTIMKVNGEAINGWSLQQVVEKIRGPKGTPVTLTVLHKSSSTAVDIKINRDTINVKSITTWVKQVKDVEGVDKTSILTGHADDKVAYLRLSQFGDSAQTEWVNAVNTLSQQVNSDKSIKGMVLDLRNNPGGYLPDAIMVGSEFIKDGVVVWQQSGQDKTAYNVSGKGLLLDVPLIVLINGGSASASEIVSGALRDHKRALLIGEKSFGKGTVQEAEDLGSGAGLHVTIAKWLTPNGTWVHMKGLTPDITVTLDPKNPDHDTQLQKAIETLLTQ